MKKQYQNFAEIWADYPAIYGMCVMYHDEYDNDGRGEVMASTLEVYICMSEENFYKNIHHPKKYWTRININPQESWFTSLEDYTPLQGLKIYLSNANMLETKQFYAQRQASFYALKHLQHLELRQASREYNLYVPNLPTLRTLHLSLCHTPQIEGVLSLDTCFIGQANQIDIADLASHLNPNTLQRLSITQTNNIHIPTKLPSFPHLKLLNLEVNYDGLRQIPFALEDCKELETLYLNNNQYIALPASILTLKNLKNLNLTTTRLKTNNIIEKESDIIDFIQQDYPQDIKEKLWAILIEDKKITQKLKLDELLQLLVSTTHKKILKKINILLEAKFKHNPLDSLPALRAMALVGKLPAMSLTEARTALKPHNITLTSNITTDTQAVCIGEEANPAIITALLAMPEKPVICLPTHLKTYLYALEKPYLTDTTEDISENLGNLLATHDKGNIMLALQMIKTGGLPPMFLEYLCLLWLEGGEWHKNIKEVLKKYTTSAQFDAIAKQINSNNYEQSLKGLFKSKHLNAFYLVEVALRYFVPRRNKSNSNAFLWHIEKILWSLKGALMEKVIAHNLDANGTLALSSTYQFHFKIPDVLIGDQRVKKLIIPNDFEVYQRLILRKLIASLPALTDLVILVPYNEYATQEENLEYQMEEKEIFEMKYPALRIHVVEKR